MKTTNEKPEPVIFRKWKDDGRVIALFPAMLGDQSEYTCGSYQHIGQHGSASPHGVVRQTLLAKPEEYVELQRELEGRGYVLAIRKRVQPHYLAVRRDQLKAKR